MKKTVNASFARDMKSYINEETLNYLTKRAIYDYRIEEIAVGRIRRNFLNREVYSLYKTESYQYLLHPGNKEVEDKYRAYCKIAIVDKANRSEGEYKKLIAAFKADDYDITKGAIVVNQYNFIEEGLHRCIILKEKGEKYKIKVVRIKQRRCRRKILIKNVIYDIKKMLHIDC